VLADYQEITFSKEQREVYKAIYQDYIYNMKSGDKQRQAERRIELTKMEEKFSLVAVKRIRMAGRLEIDFEQRKEEAKKKAEKMIKDLEGKKSSAFTSVKSFFGSSSAKEEQEKTKREVEEYRQKLLKEQEEKFIEERKNIDKELNELLSETAEVDIQGALDLPPTYERFGFKFEFDRFSLTISQGLSKAKSKRLIELSVVSIHVTFNKMVVLPFDIEADTEVWVCG
jgi:hypothetical protein